MQELETFLILNKAFECIYKALQLDFDTLVEACSFKLDFVYPLENTNLVIVKQRDRIPGFIYVSDLSTFIYCPRRFYLTYRVVNIVDKIRLEKIRKKLLELKPELREGALLYDVETFRRILIGIFLHRCVENRFKLVGLPKTYEVEKELVDEKLGLIGHADLVYVKYPEDCVDEEQCKPKATLFEIKSGLYKKEIPEGYKRQAQLYAYLLEKKCGYVVEKVYIAHPRHPAEVDKVYFKLVEVEYNKNIVKELLKLIEQARRVLTLREPPRTGLDRSKCDKCPYKLLCLY